MKFLPKGQTGDLGVGSKDQIPLNFFQEGGDLQQRSIKYAF